MPLSTFGVLLLLASGVWFYSSSSKPSQSQPAPSPAVATTDEPRVEQKRADPPPPKPLSLDQRLAGRQLAVALEVVRPLLGDTIDQPSEADLSFARWAARSLTWEDLQSVQETEPALVMKDSEAERGKRICASGSIVQIEAQRGNFGRIYGGLLLTYAGTTIYFFAAGDTGSLVAHSDARFCGIVSGRNEYKTNFGGTNQAVLAIGMFDLPSNHTAKK
jgi:hypothetical protein